jgi:aspartyl/asparaginyl beta-hydroxylase (cupin superfamily)
MDVSDAVQALCNRMNDNPEEFFDPMKNEGWSFIYKETFKDILTEPEKAMIHTALKAVRRKEFESLIVKQIFNEDNRANYKSFGKPLVAQEGKSINIEDLRIPEDYTAKRLGHR